LATACPVTCTFAPNAKPPSNDWTAWSACTFLPGTPAELAIQASLFVLSVLTSAASAGSMEFAPLFRSSAALTSAKSPATAMELPMKATECATFAFGFVSAISLSPS